MKREELNRMLELHAHWLEDPTTGERANLRGADLRDADLRWAELRGADLRDADLRGTNLCGADLCEANLRGANLCWANLSGAKGLLELPVGDPRGFRCVAVQQDDGAYLIVSGCRGMWTIEKAEQHWGAAYQGDREIGDRYLHGLQWLRERLGARP